MPYIRLCPEQVDEIIKEDLRKVLEFTYEETFDIHPDDKGYRLKIREHVKFVYGYYGGDPEEFE